MFVPVRIAQLGSALQIAVHAKGDQYVSKALIETGCWEPYETSLILQVLSEGKTFLDVGANIGYYTLLASCQVGSSGKVVAFEPEPENFSLLTSSIAKNQLNNVLAINAGLNQVDAEGRIYLSDDNFGDHQVYSNGENRSSASIKLIQGDSFLESRSVKTIDVLKVDTQGAEFDVLAGLSSVIEASLPKLDAFIEFWPAGLKRAGHSADALLDLILGWQLPMYIIDHLSDSLIPCQENDLRPWIKEVDDDPLNEGFMNLYLGNSLHD